MDEEYKQISHDSQLIVQSLMYSDAIRESHVEEESKNNSFSDESEEFNMSVNLWEAIIQDQVENNNDQNVIRQDIKQRQSLIKKIDQQTQEFNLSISKKQKMQVDTQVLSTQKSKDQLMQTVIGLKKTQESANDEDIEKRKRKLEIAILKNKRIRSKLGIKE